MKLTGLAGVTETDELVACVEALVALHPEAPPDYRELAALLALDWSKTRPRRVGLSGGQGAGKSTLSRLVESACAEVGLRAGVVALDDFYRTRAERRALAARIHPLFETRGPPGTHDIEACGAALDAMLSPGPVRLPRFDKGLDDRVGEDLVEGPFDVVVLEGWCVGAEPSEPASLDAPRNDLEREEDPEGRWRRHVNEMLAGEYARLWKTLDQTVYLRVPDLDAVRRWRLEQEQARPVGRRLDAAAVDRFVQHYERITRSMFDVSTAKADWLVRLARDHSVEGLERRGR